MTFSETNLTFILIIKRVMLVLCIILMIIPVLWTIFSKYSQDVFVKDFIASIGDKPVNLAFENLHVKMLQDNAKAINITSPHAQIYDLDISRIDLQKPKISLYEKNGTQKTLIAQIGVYQNSQNNITLSKNVKISDMYNYVIKTDKMVVDFDNFNVTLPDGVDATYKKNSLRAKNVEFDQKSNKATFKGGVRLLIQPNSSF